MCWISSTKPVPQIAESDIPIFKVMLMDSENNLESMYTHFLYVPNRKYYEKTLKGYFNSEDDQWEIHQGFHSYSSTEVEVKSGTDIVKIIGLKGRQLDLFFGTLYRIIYLVGGIVPKGACYYKNEFGEIVSNQIKLIEIKNVLGQ